MLGANFLTAQLLRHPKQAEVADRHVTACITLRSGLLVAMNEATVAAS